MKDANFAWSCAANLLLYDDDPGSRAVNMATTAETRVVDRRDALMDVYARQMLVHCEADPDRLAAARTKCADRCRPGRALREGIRAARWRSQHPSQVGWARAAGTLSPRTLVEQYRIWSTAREVATLALRMVTDAGATSDRKVRARLMAATQHTLTLDILGVLLPADVAQESAADLARRLEEIDQAADPDPPDSDPPAVGPPEGGPLPR